MENGKGYSVSLIDREQVQRIIISLYENLEVIVNREDKWLFEKTSKVFGRKL